MGLAVTGCPWGRCGAQSPVGQRRTRGGSRRTNTTGRRGRPADLRPAEPIRWAPMMSRLGRRKHVAVMSRLRRDARWLIPLNPPKNAAAPPSYFSAVLTARPTVTPLVGYFSAVLTARPTVTPLVGYFSAVFTARPTVSAIFRPFSPRAQRCPPPGPGGDSAVFLAKAQMPPLAFPAPCSVGAAVPGVLPVRPALTSAGAARPAFASGHPGRLPCCAAPGRFVPPGRSRLAGPCSGRSPARTLAPNRRYPPASRPAQHDPPAGGPARPAQHDPPAGGPARPAQHDPPAGGPARPARRRPSTTRPPEAQHDPPSTTRPPEAQHDPPAGGPARPAQHDPPAGGPARPAQHDPPAGGPARPARRRPSTTRPDVRRRCPARFCLRPPRPPPMLRSTRPVRASRPVASCWALLRPQPCPHPGPQSAVPARLATRPARPAQHDPPAGGPARPAQHDPPAGGPARPAQHDPPAGGPARPAQHDPPSTTRPPGSGPAAG